MSKNSLTRKIVIGIISIFVLSFMVFSMSRLAPGDPLVSYYGDRVERMSTEEKNIAMDRLGLNEPIYIQYGKWFKNAMNGHLGISYKYKQDVLTVIKNRLPNTLILGGISFILIFLLSLVLAIICTYYGGRLIDKIISNVGNIISIIPEFWFSLILILIFSVNLRMLPSSGAYAIGTEGNIGQRISHLILPLIVVVVSHLWYYSYIFRGKLLQEIKEDYVIMAKSKGLTDKKIILKHCLKNIMPTYISTMAIAVPHIIGGTYVVETVFSYPGLGALAFESAKYHDYNMVMVIALLTGAVTIVANILASIIGEKINPKMLLEEL